jgi:hypothetical protein
VGGPACKSVKTQGLFKLNGSAGPWISDPTADGTVDRAMVAVHRSMVDRPHKMKGYAISSVHRRSDGRECVQARAAAASPECGGTRRELAGTAPDHAVGHHFSRERALCVAERHAHSSRGSGRWIELPRRPAPEGGGAGFAGVRVPVLLRVLKGKTTRKHGAHHSWKRWASSRAEGSSSDGVRRRRRLGRRSGRRGPKLQTLHDPGGGFPWSTSIT